MKISDETLGRSMRRLASVGVGVDCILALAVFGPPEIVVLAVVVGAFLGGWWWRGRCEA